MESRKSSLKGWTRLAPWEIAAIMGVPATAVSSWVRDGCPANDDGTFPLKALIDWRLRRAAEDESARWLALMDRLL